jgi:hypothetical protein
MLVDHPRGLPLLTTAIIIAGSSGGLLLQKHAY